MLKEVHDEKGHLVMIVATAVRTPNNKQRQQEMAAVARGRSTLSLIHVA